MSQDDVQAPLAAPTYLTHITAPSFRRGRAIATAVSLHVVALLICVLVLRHHFRVLAPDEATVELVMEPSPYVGSGPTVITPVAQPIPRALAARVVPPQPRRAVAAPANVTQTSPDRAHLSAAADLPLPAPPAPPAPRPQPLSKPHPQASPAPHAGNNQPAGFGLVVSTKIIPARPDSQLNLPPAYPPDALIHGEQGRVLLSIEVAPSGRASAVNVISSSGYQILDDAARDAVLGWHFLPADDAGKAVASTLLLPIRFVIDRTAGSVQ